MNTVRERVLTGMLPYMDFSEHKDLISFCISSECFEDWDEMEENYGNSVADFNEVIVIVEKEWLFNQMKREGISNPLNYLKDELIYDEDDIAECVSDKMGVEINNVFFDGDEFGGVLYFVERKLE